MTAGDRLMTAVFRRELTKRERVIMFFVILTFAGGLVYEVPYALLDKATAALKPKIDAAAKSILELSVQAADLKAQEADIRTGEKLGVKGWNLVDQKGVILVLEDITSEAKRQGVSLVSMHPSQEVEKDVYKEVTVSLDLKGRYRELAEYFKHIETQSRLVNIRKIRVEACPDSSSACATQLEAVTYMAK